MPTEPLAFLALHALTAGGCIVRQLEAKFVRRTDLEISDQKLGKLRRTRQSASVWAPTRRSKSAQPLKMVHRWSIRSIVANQPSRIGVSISAG